MKKIKYQEYLLIITFLSTVSIFVSLYFSQIKGYTPCDLCWYQRIFMFPLPIICLDGLLNKKNNALIIKIHGFCGSLVALYHYIIQLQSQNSRFCSLVSSCSTIDVAFFNNYITLPLLSFFMFCTITLLSFLVKKDS